MDASAQAPGSLPIFGHGIQILRDPLGFLRSLPAHGDVVRIRIGPHAAVMVCTPELTRQVIFDSRLFDKGGIFFERINDVADDNLLSCPYSHHKRQRRLVQPAFHPARLQSYATDMTARILAVSDSWQDGQAIDVSAEMAKLTSGVLISAVLGSSLDEASLTRATADLDTILNGVFRRSISPPAFNQLPLPGNRRYHTATKSLHRTLHTLIQDKHAEATPGSDMLSLLLAARDQETDGQGLSDTEVANQVITFFAAGIETTAGTLSWTFDLLSRHPQIHTRLQHEVDAVLAGRPATYQDIDQLPYTQQVLDETLRLRPPQWFMTRVTTQDTRLAGHAIPAGTQIAFSNHFLHYEPSAHPDPERFDPARWEPNRTSTSQRDAYVPFGIGARKCIGDRFAYTEAVLTIATVANRWHWKAAPGNRPEPRARLTLRPQDLRMIMKRRTP
ncbi:cytochrome P450 [Streptomyces sp. MMS24-I29]|uniref:cytochrome P450 n=1 Tax=Streptomyces sp. MMS24-I29 TaxID=3351480 RepID=UPI003C7D716A